MESVHDLPRLRRWLEAVENPQVYCPFCNELAVAGGPPHAACVKMWGQLLRLAFPRASDEPEDYEHDTRPLPVPCHVLSREARVNVLLARCDKGEDLFHPADSCRMPDVEGVAVEVFRLGNGSDQQGGIICG
jgi:hypothetical protein